MTAEAAGTALDILADLGAGGRVTGFACRFSVMRVERPDLYEQWLRVKDSTIYSQRAVAEWFTNQGFRITGQTVGNHKRGMCSRCRTS